MALEFKLSQFSLLQNFTFRGACSFETKFGFLIACPQAGNMIEGLQHALVMENKNIL